MKNRPSDQNPRSFYPYIYYTTKTSFKQAHMKGQCELVTEKTIIYVLFYF